MAFLEETPAMVVSRINDFLSHFDPGIMATMFVGCIGGDGVLRYANAGHLPPLVIDAHGHAHIVEESAEPPLGSVDFWSYRQRHLEVVAGSTLILYTDGLVERRGRPMDEGLEALRQAAEAPWTNLDSLCSRLFESGQADSKPSDDVAVLALRLGADRIPEEIHTKIDADPRGLAPLRRSLRSWLAVSGADEQQTQDVLVAVGEAAANAIEHAHGPGRGVVEIDGAERDGVLEITVRDRGVWREPRGVNRGLGRSLMKAMMDEVRFHTDETGTIVTLTKRVRA
jgi:anti-sigma regulatory factor (Ser/Thr protein kinase)